MAGGNWGTSAGKQQGSSPTHLDPYCKIFLGFYNATTVSENGRFVMYATEPSPLYNILHINTEDPDVYCLVKNREQVGYDAGMWIYYQDYIKGGIVIWRIDEEVIRDYGSSNTINAHEGQYGIMPVFYRDQNGGILPFRHKNLSATLLEQLHEEVPVTIESAIGTSMSVYVGEPSPPTPMPTATPAPTAAVTPTVTLASPPTTGDNFDIGLWMSMAVLGFGGLMILLMTVKHKPGKKHG